MLTAFISLVVEYVKFRLLLKQSQISYTENLMETLIIHSDACSVGLHACKMMALHLELFEHCNFKKHLTSRRSLVFKSTGCHFTENKIWL